VTPEKQARLQDALGHVGEDWSVARVAHGRLTLHRKRRRRRAVQTVGGVTATAAVAALAWLAVPSGAPAPGMDTPGLTAGSTLLGDGSKFEILDARTAMTVDRDDEEQVRIALLDGGARFDVAPREDRQFVVDAHGVRVEVLGTHFETEVDGSRVYVRVLRGRVLVTWSGGRRTLTQGQSGLFPIDGQVLTPRSDGRHDDDVGDDDGDGDTDHAREASLESADMIFDEDDIAFDTPRPRPSRASDGRRTGPKASGTGRGSRTEDWRRMARRGDYASAYHASQHQTVGTHIEDLLLAADAARLSGHPHDAVPFLQRAVRTYPKEPRAHLAAFTLGRVLLQIGRQADAAQAFAQARRLDSKGPLGEQALAREVEAWGAAGHAARARARARQYEKEFPKGRYSERIGRYR
jgi:transmembrane sensor